ncbi:LPXTG cell wall anchor domain-containing protein [Enterococcus sp. DIV0806c]|uniref:LPXTG cell wall anchor domain-containing protein n=1 Tax=unclassified Enterococcus TaxID=2608891 RepID=UPI003F20ECCD
MKHRKMNVISCLLVILALSGPPNVIATSVQSVETEGSIHFTGRYEPTGTPDPPPTEIAKPIIEGDLPQTNATMQSYWIWLGCLLTGLVVFFGIKRNMKYKKNREN